MLHRIPAPICRRIDEIFIFDDASHDDTPEVGQACQEEFRTRSCRSIKKPRQPDVRRQPGKGYQYAMERGLDIVVLLHGDGQYAPEVMQDLLTPLENGEADMVMGSRMMVPGAALQGNMPMYKYVGNKVLTWIENKLIGTKFTEFHSGYRAYSRGGDAEHPARAADVQLALRHADHHRVREEGLPHQGSADPDVLRRRDLPRQRHPLRPELHVGGA